jgi:regulator of sigma E protease
MTCSRWTKRPDARQKERWSGSRSPAPPDAAADPAKTTGPRPKERQRKESALSHILPDAVRTVASFAIVLGILVFIHELGHYLAARWRGVHVEAFSIGFGRAFLSWTDRQGTVWKLGWLPLGGYVKLHGQERPEDVPPQVRARWIPGRTFHEKSVGSRAIVVAAGPLANFLLAAVLFAGLTATLGEPVESSVVGAVVQGSPADQAGIKPGDRLEQIAGLPTHGFDDILDIVSSRPGADLPVLLRRDGAEVTLHVQALSKQVDGRLIGQIGIASEPEYRPVGPLVAIGDGFKQMVSVSGQTLSGVWQIVTGKRGTEELGGVIRIAQLSGHVAQLGIASMVTFIAVLSINLALINLFPIPILDGGHLLFYLAEFIRGRPLPARAQEYSFRAGLAVILSLVVFSAWNDLSRLGVVRWVAGLIS